jgi:hypothetical protein
MQAVSANDERHESSTKCYRLSKTILFLGIAGLLFFAVGAIGTLFEAVQKTDGSRANSHRDVAFAAVVFSGFSILNGCLIVLYCRYRLMFSQHCVTQKGLLWQRALAVSEVYQVRWPKYPGEKSVVLRSFGRKLAIDLGDFAERDRQELIELLRHRFAGCLHDGWERYSASLLAYENRERFDWRRFMVGLVLACTGTFAFFSLWLWFEGRNPSHLLAGLILAILLAIFLSMPATWREIRRSKRSVSVH